LSRQAGVAKAGIFGIAMPAKTIDEYLSQLPPDKRSALQKLRETIHVASPTAVEVISWNIPWFKYKGKYLVAFDAFTNHCSFAPWGIGSLSALAEKHGIDLSNYDTTKHLIRFTPAKPLPSTLVKRIVKAQMQEIDAGTA
jgi:uncharacterized protein YdhG (YjbR/CyaY superfamily)